jgi:diphthamide biosynthesis protein 3
MATPYEEVALADMAWSDELQAFTYECPCGDLFQISGDELAAGEDIAYCPSCSLIVRVLCDADAFAADWEQRKAKQADAPPREAPPPPLITA